MSFEVADVTTPGNAGAFRVLDRHQAASFDELAAVHLQLLDQAVTASLATIGPDTTPQLTPCWVNREGEYLNLNTVTGRAKDRNMRARPRVALMLVSPDNPYHWMTVYGQVEGIIEETDAERGQQATDNIDDLSELYMNQRPYSLRDPDGETRVLYKVRPTKFVTFGPVE